jgi:DNA-binding protein H-NS
MNSDAKKYLEGMLELDNKDFYNLLTALHKMDIEEPENHKFLDAIQSELSDFVLNYNPIDLPLMPKRVILSFYSISAICKGLLAFEVAEHEKTNKKLVSVCKEAISAMTHLIEIDGEREEVSKILLETKKRLENVTSQRKEGGRKPPQHYRNNATKIGKLIELVENEDMTTSELKIKVFEFTKTLPDPKTIKKWREKFKKSGHIY